jgi:non-homologous end joining protein Ku
MRRPYFDYAGRRSTQRAFDVIREAIRKEGMAAIDPLAVERQTTKQRH